jgi:hypothetical protein
MRQALMAFLLAAPALATGAAAHAQSAARTPSLPGAQVYFQGIEDGATIAPKSTIRFGLRVMGVAPAGIAKAGTGHHHLLIDADPPRPGEEIPTDPQHLHFGDGATEAEIELPPGEHTLQLLLADHNHVPHDPPVISKRIHVNVLAPVKRHPSPEGAGVYFVEPRDGAVIRPTSTVRFGLKPAMGVAPAGAAKTNTGHHHLVIDSPTPSLDQEIPSDRQHLHFGHGETETVVTLPPGKHTLQLIFADENHVPHDPPVVSERITVTVRRGGQTPR